MIELEHKYIFIGGLHRSGTSLLFKMLREHPSISGFDKTGVIENEGQHLQTVYPPAKIYGGPGRFGFKSEAHITERSSLISDENRARLLNEWGKYWDMGKEYLLEKSPANLTKFRFLQALFPNSYHIMILRHLIAVSLSTKGFVRTTRSFYTLIRHWLICNEIFDSERKHLRNVLVLKYEDLVRDPGRHLGAIWNFLSLEKHDFSESVKPDVNQAYHESWRKGRTYSSHYRKIEASGAKLGRREYGWNLVFLNYLLPVEKRLIEMRFAKRVNRFGYNFSDLDSVSDYT